MGLWGYPVVFDIKYMNVKLFALFQAGATKLGDIR